MSVTIYHVFYDLLLYTTYKAIKLSRLILWADVSSAKAYTVQLLRASIITKWDKINQTDYKNFKTQKQKKHNLGAQLESHAHWVPHIISSSSGWANYYKRNQLIDPK